MDNIREYVQTRRDAAAHALEAARDGTVHAAQRTLTRAADAARDQRDRAVAQLAAAASDAAGAASRAGRQAASDAFTAAVDVVAAQTAPYRRRASRFMETGQVRMPRAPSHTAPPKCIHSVRVWIAIQFHTPSEPIRCRSAVSLVVWHPHAETYLPVYTDRGVARWVGGQAHAAAGAGQVVDLLQTAEDGVFESIKGA